MLILKGSHNITGKYNPPKHKGIDIGWNRNNNLNKVYANSYGVVYKTLDHIPHGSEQGGGWGNYVLIKHPNGYYSRYAHLKENLPVKVGDEVDNNTIIGDMGDSGRATAKHLHFEVQTTSSSNSRIDPTRYVDLPIYVPPEKLIIGDKVQIIGFGNSRADGKGKTARGIGYIRKIKKIYDGKEYPYQVGNLLGTTGFYKSDALKKIK